MRVVGLWRYPVKSMRGEACESLNLTARGADGDRAYGILDVESGTVLSAKREGRLLQARAFMAGPELVVRLPTGETVLGVGPTADSALSYWLGRPVRLVRASAHGHGTYECPTDFEDDNSDTYSWEGPEGSFVDDSPLHLVSTSTLATMSRDRPDLDWNVARFRPNILVDTEGRDAPEQEWLRRTLTVGGSELHIDKPCSRCVMTTRPQPDHIERQLDILRHINSLYATNLGVYARVTRSGAVERGQQLSLSG